ncbi:uncharacterized protein LOC124117673 [Haliotis rufescens]|uniref:uncharacterized protein LOC124117673 n=1 Tax=Haliotis rufescens TaxID=6454 RepID=UPI00201E9A70|nr:uncharacterized protein LOC124117673 [Haliotis rufescens]
MWTVGVLLACTLCAIPNAEPKTLGESLGINTCDRETDIVFVLDMSVATDCLNLAEVARGFLIIANRFKVFLRATVVMLWENSVEKMCNFIDNIRLGGYFRFMMDLCFTQSLKPGLFEKTFTMATKLLTEMTEQRPSALKFIVFMIKGDFSRYDDGRLDAFKDYAASNPDVHILSIIYETDMVQLKTEMKFLDLKSKLFIRDITSLDEDIRIFLWNICPVCVGGSGWTYYGLRCYLAVEFPEDITWLEAKHQCRIRGGYLTTIRNSEEEAFLNKLVPSSSDTTYIGNCILLTARWCDVD